MRTSWFRAGCPSSHDYPQIRLGQYADFRTILDVFDHYDLLQRPDPVKLRQSMYFFDPFRLVTNLGPVSSLSRRSLRDNYPEE